MDGEELSPTLSLIPLVYMSTLCTASGISVAIVPEGQKLNIFVAVGEH